MRGAPGPITRRRVAAGVIVVATGGVATVAVAAGPVVYSEYTTGGSRENRIVDEDGSGDRPFGGRDVSGAAVSPDGLRIARTELDTNGRRGDLDDYTSTLVVSAADGSGPRTIARAAAADDSGPAGLLVGTPVWAPDSRRVIVTRLRFGERDGTGYRRQICDVVAGTCSDAAAATRPEDDGSFRLARGDVATWQAADGPIVFDAVRGGRTASLVRCGARGGTTAGPTVALHGLAGSSFGRPIQVRGLDTGSSRDTELGLATGSAGALAVADGTLVLDSPAAATRIGRLRCGGSFPEYTGRAILGVPRLRLRAGGVTRTLPTPPGLRRGDGLRLVGTDDGGAVLVTVRNPGGRLEGYCSPTRRRDVRDCGGFFQTSGGGPEVLRVWRFVPGAQPRFDRVTTARRSALRTLAGAKELAAATGDALVAVTDDSIVRVPLDGGVPTTLARGEELSLELSAP